MQFSDAVGFQQGCFRLRKVAALQELFAQPVPANGVKLQVASAIGAVGALAEQLGRFWHAVLPRAQGGQLDQQLGRCSRRSCRTCAPGAFDPLRRGFQFSHFGVERCDVDIQYRGVAGVAGLIGQAMRLQEGAQSGLILVESELATAQVAGGARGYIVFPYRECARRRDSNDLRHRHTGRAVHVGA